MNLRIGGEIEIDPASLSGCVHHALPGLPKRHVTRLATGRSSLLLALHDIIRRGGKRKAWLPAYICQSVVSVFERMGFDLNYYSTGASLAEPVFPDAISSGDTFLYVHYFGKTNVAALEWLNQSDLPKTLHVIEDCVQASLNSNVGSAGNYAITSYRKFLPQPDGALLGSNLPIETEADEPDEVFVSARFLGKLLRHQFAPEERFLSLFSESENRLENDSRPRKMSRLSEFMMQCTDLAAISDIRRRNWATLMNGIITSTLIPVFNDLDEGEVPLGFPVKVADGKRDMLRRRLAENQIYCPVHWELPHLQNIGGWQEEQDLSRSILTLPIDQRIGEAHLDHMVRTINSFSESHS